MVGRPPQWAVGCVKQTSDPRTLDGVRLFAVNTRQGLGHFTYMRLKKSCWSASPDTHYPAPRPSGRHFRDPGIDVHYWDSTGWRVPSAGSRRPHDHCPASRAGSTHISELSAAEPHRTDRCLRSFKTTGLGCSDWLYLVSSGIQGEGGFPSTF